jgi:hypothetical protein
MKSLMTVLVMSVAALGLPTAPPRPAVADAPKQDDAQAELLRLEAVVKPTAAELKWQKIPWILDLAEGQRLAKAEGRPLFLWASGDPPLERC